MVPSNLQRFVNCESGAVTVDWVVLTAGVALIGAAVVLGIKSGQDSIGAQVGDNLSTGAETVVTPNFN